MQAIKNERRASKVSLGKGAESGWCHSVKKRFGVWTGAHVPRRAETQTAALSFSSSRFWESFSSSSSSCGVPSSSPTSPSSCVVAPVTSPSSMTFSTFSCGLVTSPLESTLWSTPSSIRPTGTPSPATSDVSTGSEPTWVRPVEPSWFPHHVLHMLWLLCWQKLGQTEKEAWTETATVLMAARRATGVWP